MTTSTKYIKKSVPRAAYAIVYDDGNTGYRKLPAGRISESIHEGKFSNRESGIAYGSLSKFRPEQIEFLNLEDIAERHDIVHANPFEQDWEVREKHYVSMMDEGIAYYPHQITILKYPKPILLEVQNTVCEYPSQLKSIVDIIKNYDNIIQELNEEPQWLEFAKKIESDTWKRAIKILSDYSIFIYETYSRVLIPPQINPAPNGSIDLKWQTEQSRFLLNVKTNDNHLIASSFGDLYGFKQRIKQNLIEGDGILEHLAFWMSKYISK